MACGICCATSRTQASNGGFFSALSRFVPAIAARSLYSARTGSARLPHRAFMKGEGLHVRTPKIYPGFALHRNCR